MTMTKTKSQYQTKTHKQNQTHPQNEQIPRNGANKKDKKEAIFSVFFFRQIFTERWKLWKITMVRKLTHLMINVLVPIPISSFFSKSPLSFFWYQNLNSSHYLYFYQNLIFLNLQKIRSKRGEKCQRFLLRPRRCIHYKLATCFCGSESW